MESTKLRLISLQDVVSGSPLKRTNAPINFSLYEGEHIAILGDNGSGKTTISQFIRSLVQLRSGQISYQMGNELPAYQNIATLTFRSEYDSTDFYFQQRWNSTEYENCPKVCEVVEGLNPNPKLLEALKIDRLLNSRLIELSSGELRRFNLFRSLSAAPKVLIIDNLYVGLDIAMRSEIDEALSEVVKSLNISIITLASRKRDIPSFTTHIYLVKDGVLGEKQPFKREDFPVVSHFSNIETAVESAVQICSHSNQEVVNFEDINIRFGPRVLFDHFSWQINSGERWLLTGGNGSGKTTLLSLISGDNPMAYAQKFSLFGKKRGSGESIWDIKRRLAFLSPEMLRGFEANIASVNIVASGFFDTVGLFQTPTEEQLEKSLKIMKEFGIDAIAQKSFLKISSGEQRMVLVARAFVKNPELLILDEPFHELDEKNCKIVANRIMDYAKNLQNTIIYVSHYSDDIPPITTNRLQL